MTLLQGYAPSPKAALQTRALVTGSSGDAPMSRVVPGSGSDMQPLRPLWESPTLDAHAFEILFGTVGLRLWADFATAPLMFVARLLGSHGSVSVTLAESQIGGVNLATPPGSYTFPALRLRGLFADARLQVLCGTENARTLTYQVGGQIVAGQAPGRR